MNLPASEIGFWREYYSIYPFPQEREDIRNASLLTMYYNSHVGKNAKQVSLDDFIPDYLGTRKNATITEKSIEQQIEEERIFIQKLQSNRRSINRKRKEG